MTRRTDSRSGTENKPAEPNKVILQAVSAEDISNLNINKLSEMDKLLDGHLASVTSDKPHASATGHKSGGSRADSSLKEKNKDENRHKDGAQDKKQESQDKKQESSQANKENKQPKPSSGLSHQAKKAKQDNQDNIVIVNRQKPQKAPPPKVIPHNLSDSDQDVPDPRSYRFDPSAPVDLSVPAFMEEEDGEIIDHSDFYDGYRARVKRSFDDGYESARPVAKRPRWPQESFYDPVTRTEYMPIYSHHPVRSARPREYFYPQRRRPMVPTYPYSGGSHYLDDDEYEFDYEDENIELVDEDPRVHPIPMRHLLDPSLDEHLVRVAPKTHNPVATSTPQHNPAPSTSSRANDSPAVDSNSTQPTSSAAAGSDPSPANDLLDEYLLPDDSGTGPDLAPRMLKLAHEYWDKGICDFEKLQVTDAYERLQRPQNASNLVPTLVNPEIRMPKNSPITIKDRQLRALQHSVLKAAYGTLNIMAQAYNTQSPLDHKSLIDISVDTYRCLAYSNGRISKMRKHNVRPLIDPSLRSICDKVEDPPSHSLLLGADIKKTCQEASDALKLQVSTSKKKKQRGRATFRFQRGYYNRYIGEFSPFSFANKRGGRHVLVDDFNMHYSEPWYENIAKNYVDSSSEALVNFDQSPSKKMAPKQKKCVFDFSQETSKLVRSGKTRMVPASLPSRTQSAEIKERQLVQLPSHKVSLLDINLHQFLFKAGGVGLCIDAWKKLTSDPHIINIVKGITLDFESPPVQLSLPHEIQFSHKEQILVQKEIDRLLDLGIITKTSLKPGDFVSNFFTRPKKDKNKIRCILNAKSVNKFIRFKHFKMDNLQTALNILRPGMYMATLDIVDSYFSIPIRESYKKYLKFRTLGQYFQFEVMPQGFRDSSYIFVESTPSLLEARIWVSLSRIC